MEGTGHRLLSLAPRHYLRVDRQQAPCGPTLPTLKPSLTTIQFDWRVVCGRSHSRTPDGTSAMNRLPWTVCLLAVADSSFMPPAHAQLHLLRRNHGLGLMGSRLARIFSGSSLGSELCCRTEDSTPNSFRIDLRIHRGRCQGLNSLTGWELAISNRSRASLRVEDSHLSM